MIDVNGYNFKFKTLAKEVCESWPGGIAAVARGIGTGAMILKRKTDPSNERHALMLGEAAALIACTQDHRIVDELAALVNRTSVSVPHVSKVEKPLEGLATSFSKCVPGLVKRKNTAEFGREDAIVLQQHLMEFAGVALSVARDIREEIGRSW